VKKTSLIINIVLILAVAVLYVLYFTNPRSAAKTPKSTYNTDTLDVVTSQIVYVNMDTLLANYDMFADYQNKFAAKQKSSEAKLNSKTQQWQNKVNNYQDNMKKGLITRSQAQKIEQQLSQEQQDIVKLKNDLSSKLMEDQQVMNRRILYSIMDYLKDYNLTHHYKYILSTTMGGNVLYADKNFDITLEIIDGLNKHYQTIRDSVLKAE